MLTSAPEQLVPLIVVLAALCLLAVTAWWAASRSGRLPIAALAIGTYAFLIAGASVALGPWLVGPLLLLIATYASALEAPARAVTRSLVRIGVLTLGAFAAAYLFAQVWALRLGRFPGGGFESFWLYVALASAAGIAFGLGLTGARRDIREIARGMVVAHAGFGAAGVAVALGSLPIVYPRGSYVSLGLAALWGALFWLVFANTITTSIAIKALGRVWWSGAVGAEVVLTCVALFSGIATVAAFGPLAVSGVAPPLLILPNTATAP